MHLVILVFCVSLERLSWPRDSRRHCFGAFGWSFCARKGLHSGFWKSLDSRRAKSLLELRAMAVRWPCEVGIPPADFEFLGGIVVLLVWGREIDI